MTARASVMAHTRVRLQLVLYSPVLDHLVPQISAGIVFLMGESMNWIQDLDLGKTTSL